MCKLGCRVWHRRRCGKVRLHLLLGLTLLVERNLFNICQFWYLIDVLFGCSSNVCDCILHQLDSSSSVIGNDVSSDIRLTLLTEDDDTIKGTLFDSISPDKWHAPRLVVVSKQLHSILMTFGDGVVEYLTFVILNLDANSTNLDFVLDDVRVNILSCDDG
jgi:hypothetical protein